MISYIFFIYFVYQVSMHLFIFRDVWLWIEITLNVNALTPCWHHQSLTAAYSNKLRSFGWLCFSPSKSSAMQIPSFYDPLNALISLFLLTPDFFFLCSTGTKAWKSSSVRTLQWHITSVASQSPTGPRSKEGSSRWDSSRSCLPRKGVIGKVTIRILIQKSEINELMKQILMGKLLCVCV